jgi:hypothetical protein
MPIIDNPELYSKAKKIADEKYSKPSAYKSGFIVKKYKELGGTYTDDKEPKNLERWFKENWKDIGGLEYPVYRPTKKINKNTPLIPDEIDFNNLLEQIFLKQKIKGESNLPKFKEGKGLYEISPYAYKQAKKLGVKIEPSTKKFKKIDIYDYNNQYIMSVGDIRYNDYRSFIKEKGKEYADEKRRLYKIRHNKDRNKLGSAGYYADQLLWN